MSADPLAVHVPGEADWNLYAYVSGQILRNTDPLGLDKQKSWDGGIDFYPTVEAEGSLPSGPMPVDKSGFIDGQTYRLRPVLSRETGEVDYYVATHKKTHEASWVVDNTAEDIHGFLENEGTYATAAGYYFGLFGRTSRADALTVRLVEQSLSGDLSGAWETYKAIWGAAVHDPAELLKLAMVTAGMAAANNSFTSRVTQAQRKLPKDWVKRPNAAMLKDPKKAGYRFTPAQQAGKEGAQANGVRIDKGSKSVSQPVQQVDHVVVRRHGQIIGRDGKPLKPGTKMGDDPANTHIPLDEWIKWKSWFSPE